MVNDMDTGRKLALLMSIFNVNTRGLARAIHVDPSSVSRWINGKRSLTANSDYLNKIADYFVHVSSFEKQKLKLKELMFSDTDLQGISSEKLVQSLMEWLLSDEAPDPVQAGTMKQEPYPIGSLLDALSVQPMRIPDHFSLPVSIPGKEIPTELYTGDDGIRKALLNVANALLDQESPGVLLITSQDDLSWYMKPEFLSKWMLTLGTLLQRGHRIRVIFRLHRNAGSIITLIKNWVPYMRSGLIDTFYYTYYQEPPIAMTLAVAPGHAAMFSMKAAAETEHGVSFVHRDELSVAFYLSKFGDLLSQSRPLVDVFTERSLPRLMEEQATLEEKNGDGIVFYNGINPRFFPPEVYGCLLERTSLSSVQRAQNGKLHTTRRAALLRELSGGEHYEFCSIEAVEAMMHSGFCVYEQVDLFAGEPVRAEASELLSLMKSLLELVLTYPNFHLTFFTSEGILPEHFRFWSIKSGSAVTLSALGEHKSPFFIVCKEQTVVSGFEEYSGDLMQRIPHALRDRETVIKKLGVWIGRLESYVQV